MTRHVLSTVLLLALVSPALADVTGGDGGTPGPVPDAILSMNASPRGFADRPADLAAPRVPQQILSAPFSVNPAPTYHEGN